MFPIVSYYKKIVDGIHNADLNLFVNVYDLIANTPIEKITTTAK